MKQRKRLLFLLIGTLAGAYGLCVPREATAAELGQAAPAAAIDSSGAIQVPAGPFLLDSGAPPPELRLRAIVVRALDDSVATWGRIMQGRSAEVAAVNVRFVSRLAPDNCYGLYSGDGPAYCSGNQTVFVGTDFAGRLMARFGREAEAGITYLVGHEIGHHIQNLDGGFIALSQAIYAHRDDVPDYVRRFELQADC